MSKTEAKTDREKLQILLQHWIEHNQEHSQEFREWAEKARSLGEVSASDLILDAAREMDKANQPLQQALKTLEKK